MRQFDKESSTTELKISDWPDATDQVSSLVVNRIPSTPNYIWQYFWLLFRLWFLHYFGSKNAQTSRNRFIFVPRRPLFVNYHCYNLHRTYFFWIILLSQISFKLDLVGHCWLLLLTTYNNNPECHKYYSIIRQIICSYFDQCVWYEKSRIRRRLIISAGWINNPHNQC